MLLASTGQPSFYPESHEENKNEIKEDKIEDKEIDTKEKNSRKDSIDFGEKGKDNDNKTSIFDFH